MRVSLSWFLFEGSFGLDLFSYASEPSYTSVSDRLPNTIDKCSCAIGHGLKKLRNNSSSIESKVKDSFLLKGNKNYREVIIQLH